VTEEKAVAAMALPTAAKLKKRNAWRRVVRREVTWRTSLSICEVRPSVSPGDGFAIALMHINRMYFKYMWHHTTTMYHQLSCVPVLSSPRGWTHRRRVSTGPGAKLSLESDHTSKEP
jgi:hypothetical protein